MLLYDKSYDIKEAYYKKFDSLLGEENKDEVDKLVIDSVRDFYKSIQMGDTLKDVHRYLKDVVLNTYGGILQLSETREFKDKGVVFKDGISVPSVSGFVEVYFTPISYLPKDLNIYSEYENIVRIEVFYDILHQVFEKKVCIEKKTDESVLFHISEDYFLHINYASLYYIPVSMKNKRLNPKHFNNMCVSPNGEVYNLGVLDMAGLFDNNDNKSIPSDNDFMSYRKLGIDDLSLISSLSKDIKQLLKCIHLNDSVNSVNTNILNYLSTTKYLKYAIKSIDCDNKLGVYEKVDGVDKEVGCTLKISLNWKIRTVTGYNDAFIECHFLTKPNMSAYGDYFTNGFGIYSKEESSYLDSIVVVGVDSPYFYLDLSKLHNNIGFVYDIKVKEVDKMCSQDFGGKSFGLGSFGSSPFNDLSFSDWDLNMDKDLEKYKSPKNKEIREKYLRLLENSYKKDNEFIIEKLIDFRGLIEEYISDSVIGETEPLFYKFKNNTKTVESISSIEYEGVEIGEVLAKFNDDLFLHTISYPFNLECCINTNGEIEKIATFNLPIYYQNSPTSFSPCYIKLYYDKDNKLVKKYQHGLDNKKATYLVDVLKYIEDYGYIYINPEASLGICTDDHKFYNLCNFNYKEDYKELDMSLLKYNAPSNHAISVIYDVKKELLNFISGIELGLPLDEIKAFYSYSKRQNPYINKYLKLVEDKGYKETWKLSFETDYLIMDEFKLKPATLELDFKNGVLVKMVVNNFLNEIHYIDLGK